MSVSADVKLGRVKGLEAMRNKLAEAMDEAEPAVVAQIAGRLQAVLKELAELSKGSEEGIEDVLAKRRAARVAASKSSAAAKPRRSKRSG